MKQYLEICLHVFVGFLIGLAVKDAFSLDGDNKGIIGELNWREIKSFPKDSPEYQNSLAVGDVHDSRGFRCNGAHIGNGNIFTAGHCCSVDGNRFNNSRCEVGRRDIRTDVCILKCNISKNFPLVKIGTEITEEIYVLHKNCDFISKPGCALSMKYSPGQIIRVEGERVIHSGDTLGGSSGAGIFNSHHMLIGIHQGFSPNENLNYGRMLGEINND